MMPTAPAKEPVVSVAIAFVFALVGVWLAAESRIQAQTPIEGAWTLNKDLSDEAPARDADRDGGQERGRRGGGGYGRGGGFGGGMRGGGGGGRSRGNPEDAARMREAMHDEMTAADHLTITQTESMVVITTQDGRTTRLSPDGKKVKDENTKIERKTKWDADKLVSEIDGLGPGKITETYSVDPEKHQLTVTVHTEGGRNRPARTLRRVYDASPSSSSNPATTNRIAVSVLPIASRARLMRSE
jgi:hypothetical protein